MLVNDDSPKFLQPLKDTIGNESFFREGLEGLST